MMSEKKRQAQMPYRLCYNARIGEKNATSKLRHVHYDEVIIR